MDIYGGFLQLRAGCSRDQYVKYPTQPPNKNKTKIDRAFLKRKLMEKGNGKKEMEKSVELYFVLSAKSPASLYSNSTYDTNINRRLA